MKKVKLGIIGIGNMGSVHVRNILEGKVEGISITGISSRNPDRSELFPEVPFYENADDLIGAEEIEAVLICTPHNSHKEIGLKVLGKGKHLLMEKPLCRHKQECEALIAAHADNAVVFAVMFNQRTDPRYRKLKEMMVAGVLGKVHRVVWMITDFFRSEQYYASGGWRATWAGEGGGVLMNQCPHQLDLWQWLFGMPEKIRAHCSVGRFHDIEVEDDVTCFMSYANGCQGVFITTTGESPGTNRLEIAAENGRLIIDSNEAGIQWDKNEVPISEWSRQTDGGFTKPPARKVVIPTEGKGAQHLGILENFGRAIREGESLIAPGIEGIHSVELANAMIYSGLTDKTITLPLDAMEYADWLKGKTESSTHVKRTVKRGIASDFDQS